MEHKFNYNWSLSDATFTKDKGKVFSCFACGGGSTMGYKLAGFDVIGDNEIDPKMNEMYIANHHPRINYLCDIRELVVKAQNHEIEDELYNLDILDASFPCSSFSMSGNREKDWGKEKVFREGQKSQVLDTLCFDTIQLTDALRPKIILFENVKGIILGNAKEYTKKIIEELDKIGYHCQYWLLNGKTMGLPQARERVFFIGIRKDYAQEKQLIDDLGKIKINMDFNEKEIFYREFADDLVREKELLPGSRMREYWDNRQEGDRNCGDVCRRLCGKYSSFANLFLYKDKVLPTITASTSYLCFHKPSRLSDTEFKLASSFPQDYNFLKNKVQYVVGMAVPPIMMAQVSSRIYEYLLK